MTAEDVYQEARSRGIELNAAGDRIAFRAPKGALSDDLARDIQWWREELLDLLRSGPSNQRDKATPQVNESSERNSVATALRDAPASEQDCRVVASEAEKPDEIMEHALAIIRATFGDVEMIDY